MHAESVVHTQLCAYIKREVIRMEVERTWHLVSWLSLVWLISYTECGIGYRKSMEGPSRNERRPYEALLRRMSDLIDRSISTQLLGTFVELQGPE